MRQRAQTRVARSGIAQSNRAVSGRLRTTSGAVLPREAHPLPEGTQHTNLTTQRAVPVRDTLQFTYRVVRDKNIADAILFSIFFASFTFMVFNWYDVHEAYSSDAAIVDLFVDEEFPGAQYKKNYDDIMTQGEWWQWAEGPLLNGLHPQEWGNGAPKEPSSQGYVLDIFRLVGDIRIRQTRVSNQTCDAMRVLFEKSKSACGSDDPEHLSLPCRKEPESFVNGYDQLDGTCVCGAFDTKDGACHQGIHLWTAAGAQEHPKYWAGNLGGPVVSEYDPDMSALYGLSSFQPIVGYGTGGYKVFLSGTDRDDAAAKLAALRKQQWIDRGTRAVAVDFNLYNTQAGLLTVARFTVEFLHTGYVARTYRLFSLRLVLYSSALDMVRLAVEILYTLLLMYYMVREFRRGWRGIFKSVDRLAYWNMKTLFELVIFGVNGAMGVLWLKYVSDDRKANFDVNELAYVDLHGTGQRFSNCFAAVAVLGLLYSLKLFVFLSISQRMNALWMILRFAATDLMFFGIGGLVLLGGFAFCGMFLFGHMNIGYHDLPTSMSTLLRYPLGEFDYESLTMAAPIFGPAFFVVYVAIMFIVVMNLFIGIINKYFDEVHEILKTTDWWKASAQQWMYPVTRKFTEWRLRFSVTRGSNLKPEHIKGFDADKELRHYERRLQHALRNALRSMKHERNMDFFQYLTRIYERELQSDNMYISEDELCAVTQANLCRGGVHNLDCVGRRVVEAYHQFMQSEMPFSVEHPMPQSLRQRPGSNGQQMYEVAKLSRQGYLQHRTMSIDANIQESRLLNWERIIGWGGAAVDAQYRWRRRKVLPLSQLTKIDVPTEEQVRQNPSLAQLLRLTFTSQGFDGNADIPEPRSLDTQYRLIFLTKTQKDAFVAELERAVELSRAAQQGRQQEGVDQRLANLEQAMTTQMQAIQELTAAVHGAVGLGPSASVSPAIAASSLSGRHHRSIDLTEARPDSLGPTSTTSLTSATSPSMVPPITSPGASDAAEPLEDF